MLPQSVNSLLIRLLVPDPSPEKPTAMQIKQQSEELKLPKNNETYTSSVTNLNHRIVSTGKNL